MTANKDIFGLSKEDLRTKPENNPAPHVVILGAGASRAAFPDGDFFGQPIPLMNNLPKILKGAWEQLVAEANAPVGNFESQFSWIRQHGGFGEQLADIEKILKQYFEGLELPEEPTIYDYLVMGLRKQDVIATFNWDPFLLQAHERNRGVVELPDIRFLHGCVSFATCAEHDILGNFRERCPFCKTELICGCLFYPEADKDYTKDAFIKRDWDILTKQLTRAFHLTIFGYSGPATDFNARKLLLDGWSQTPFWDHSHTEIIDVKPISEIYEPWSDFIPHDHVMPQSSFWESTIARWPRRTFEYKRAASFYGLPSEDVGVFKTDSLAELQSWFAALAEAEDATPETQGQPPPQDD